MELVSTAMLLLFSRRPAQTPYSTQPITTCTKFKNGIYLFNHDFSYSHPPKETDVVFFLFEIDTGNSNFTFCASRSEPYETRIQNKRTFNFNFDLCL